MKDKLLVPPHIKGLIFDCDGTLVNSMPLHMKAWRAACAGFNMIFDYDFFFSKKGMHEDEIVDLYNEINQTNFPSDLVVKSKHEYFRKHSDSITSFKVVADLAAKYHGILPMAVVSGGTRLNVESSLQTTGLKKYFEIIITADDGLNQKPAPDMFLHAALKMNVVPEFCQVFEDGDLGIEAAHAAGMLATDVRPFTL